MRCKSCQHYDGAVDEQLNVSTIRCRCEELARYYAWSKEFEAVGWVPVIPEEVEWECSFYSPPLISSHITHPKVMPRSGGIDKYRIGGK